MWAARAESHVRLERTAREGQDGANVEATATLTQRVRPPETLWRQKLGELIALEGRLNDGAYAAARQTQDLSALMMTALAAAAVLAAVAVARMQQQLCSLVGDIRTSAENVHVASAEVAAGNSDLSQRTERGAGSLQQTTSAVQQIADGIDGNAFQTNILALNADARLVDDAGATMKEIVASVQRVMEIVGGITISVAEQSEGLSHVNAAVAQLDQMTQQNAALVEQSATTAECLRSQALKLTSCTTPPATRP